MKKWWLVICLIFIYTIPLISAQEKPIIITKMFLVSTKDGRKNWGITFFNNSHKPIKYMVLLVTGYTKNDDKCFCRINYHYSVRASIEEPVPAKSYSTSVLEGWYNKNLDKYKIEQIKILYHDNTIRRIHIWEFRNLINRNTVEQKYIDLADVYNYE